MLNLKPNHFVRLYDAPKLIDRNGVIYEHGDYVEIEYLDYNSSNPINPALLYANGILRNIDYGGDYLTADIDDKDDDYTKDISVVVSHIMRIAKLEEEQA